MGNQSPKSVQSSWSTSIVNRDSTALKRSATFGYNYKCSRPFVISLPFTAWMVPEQLKIAFGIIIFILDHHIARPAASSLDFILSLGSITILESGQQFTIPKELGAEPPDPGMPLIQHRPFLQVSDLGLGGLLQTGNILLPLNRTFLPQAASSFFVHHKRIR